MVAMKLIYTFEDRDEGEMAHSRLVGEKRLASERDGAATVYNLFGEPSWGNFYRLELFNLLELESILKAKASGLSYSQDRFKSILLTLEYVAKQYQLKLPDHWRR